MQCPLGGCVFAYIGMRPTIWLDFLQAPKPTSQHIIDDAGVLNRTTKKAVNDKLTRFEVGCKFLNPINAATGQS